MPSVPNFKLVTPAERAKLAPLLRHYAKSAHPFTACVRDNRKRFGPRAEQVCAVVKDMIRGTTMWRGKGKNMSIDGLRRAVELADASGIDCDQVKRARRLVELAERTPAVLELANARMAERVAVDASTFAAMVELARERGHHVKLERDESVVELARSRAGLVPTKVTVRHRSGKTYQRTMYLRPKQAKAMKAGKGGQQVSAQGAEVTKATRNVLSELSKVPRDQRPKGWEDAVKALATARHGGRLGSERRKALRDLQSSAPDGPLKDAVTAALKADAPKGKAKKVQKRKQARTERRAFERRMERARARAGR